MTHLFYEGGSGLVANSFSLDEFRSKDFTIDTTGYTRGTAIYRSHTVYKNGLAVCGGYLVAQPAILDCDYYNFETSTAVYF